MPAGRVPEVDLKDDQSATIFAANVQVAPVDHLCRYDKVVLNMFLICF